MIEMNKRYKTRSGKDVRILCVDGPYDDYPVIGIVSGHGTTTSWSKKGEFVPNNGSSLYDLVEVKKSVRVKGWIVSSKSNEIWTHDFYYHKNVADTTANRHKRCGWQVAVVEVDLESFEV